MGGESISMRISFDTERFGEKLSDDELIKLVRHKEDRESMLAALKELFRRKTPRRLDICQEVLGDPAQSTRAKETVVVQLGAEHLVENQELLLQHLNTTDPPVFARIVQSLGKIGDERALKRLEETKAQDVAMARQSLDFAKSLLAYRLRLDRNLIASPPDTDLVEVTNGLPIKITKAKANEIREAFRHVKKDLPAISLAAEGATKLTCPSVELLLVFTDKFHETESIKSIQDRSALPLVLLKKAYSLGFYFLSQYLFTHPSEDRKEVVLLGSRPVGDLTYAGNIQISEKGVEFKLRSVDSLYAPAIEVEGQYDPNQRSVTFTKAISSTKEAARKTKAKTPHKVSPSLG
jgi:hypothetical protein